MDQDGFMAKLEQLHQIKCRSEQVTALGHSLKDEAAILKSEQESLRECQSELDQLLAEKLHHVEQLRQIHSDINMVENLIKQGQECLKQSEARSRVLFKEYLPLKKELDNWKTACGLELSSEANLDLDSADFAVSTENVKQKTSKKSVDGEPSSLTTTTTSKPHSTGSVPPSGSNRQFRLPPMKQCVACLQYIHRNAPICPLCKAKSRSRNPKRPRR